MHSYLNIESSDDDEEIVVQKTIRMEGIRGDYMREYEYRVRHSVRIVRRFRIFENLEMDDGHWD